MTAWTRGLSDRVDVVWVVKIAHRIDEIMFPNRLPELLATVNCS